MKNRSVIGILCIVLAIGITFAVSPLVNKMTEGKTEVVQLTRQLGQGEKITGSDIKMVSIGSFGLAAGVIKSPDEVVGKFASSKLYPNTNLFQDMFTEKANLPEDIFRNLSDGTQAISITIPNLASGLSGKLQQGDIVSAIVVTQEGGVIPPELRYLRVVTATASSGMDTNPGLLKQGDNQKLPATVTVLANKEQSTLLAYHDRTSMIHLSLVFRGDKAIAEKFLEAQARVFDEEENIHGEGGYEDG